MSAVIAVHQTLYHTGSYWCSGEFVVRYPGQKSKSTAERSWGWKLWMMTCVVGIGQIGAVVGWSMWIICWLIIVVVGVTVVGFVVFIVFSVGEVVCSVDVVESMVGLLRLLTGVYWNDIWSEISCRNCLDSLRMDIVPNSAYLKEL